MSVGGSAGPPATSSFSRWMRGIDAAAVEPDQAGGVGGADRRVAAQILTRTGKFECQVDQRGEQHQRGWAIGGDVRLQQQVDR